MPKHKCLWLLKNDFIIWLCYINLCYIIIAYASENVWRKWMTSMIPHISAMKLKNIHNK